MTDHERAAKLFGDILIHDEQFSILDACRLACLTLRAADKNPNAVNLALAMLWDIIVREENRMEQSHAH